jgi:drug/metabolite transporter (DMT)-like permease
MKYLPLLVPLIVIQLALMIVALVDILRREKTRGPKWLWIAVVVLGEMIGPILYFVIGRDES